MNRFMRFLSYFCIGLIVVAFLTWTWLRNTSATAADFQSFKRGDVIFQTSTSSQSLAILLASSSRFSHMGIVDVDEEGQQLVLEATSTTRATPLREWVDRGAGARIAVYRFPELTEVDAKSIISAGRMHFGKAYDLFFHASEDQLYCSEFVHLAFKAGASIELGQFQKIGSLHLDNFAARRVIKSRWERHPACANGQAKDFESCFALLQDQDLITPHSIANDNELQLIYSNYP